MTNYQWQPIETAPKDGSWVLVTNGGYIYIAYWNVEPEIWGVSRDEAVACWTVFEPEDYFYAIHLIEYDEPPTHWMSLPDPPGRITINKRREEMKRFEIKVVIQEGNDEFWDGISESPYGEVYEVQNAVEEALKDASFDVTTIPLKFEEKFE